MHVLFIECLNVYDYVFYIKEKTDFSKLNIFIKIYLVCD